MSLAVLAPTVAATAPQTTAGGVPWWLFVLIAVVVVAVGGALLLVALRGKGPTEIPCPKCGKTMMSDWEKCMFCKAPRVVRSAALEFVSGPLSGTIVQLEGEVTTIGTAVGSTVTLSDAGVSRKHAGIRRDAGNFELADLGSTNGVYVNGERVAKKKLELGDVIRVGSSEMVFKN